MVLSKVAISEIFFYYKGEVIKNVKEFKYLGIILSRTGSFTKAKKHLCEKAQKALQDVIRNKLNYQ